MAAVLNRPMPADVSLHLFCSLLFQTTHVVASLAPDLAIAGGAPALDHDDASQTFPCRPYLAVHPVELMADDGLAVLLTTVGTAFALMVTPVVGIELADVELSRGELEMVANLTVQTLLLVFDSQQVVAFPIYDLRGDFAP